MARSSEDRELPKINLPTFIGGEAIDFKNGIPGSFYTSQAMDFRQKASQMTVLPGMRTIADNLKDKITVIEQDIAGMRYGVGDQGWIYKIDASNNVTVIDQLPSNGAAGMVYNPQNDQLYMSEQQSVSLYGQTQSNPQLRKANFGSSASVAPGVIYIFNTTTNSYDGGTVSGVSTQRNNLNTLTATAITPQNYQTKVTNTLSNTFVLPKADSQGNPPEDIGKFCAFIPDIEPFYGIAVYVAVKGTGDWTLTMHDSLNNNLAQVTIPNAQVTTGWNMFKFPGTGVRAFVNAIASVNGATGYHFHLTSSVASDTAAVYTIAASDLTGCNFVLFAHRLVATKNGWHPMCIFNQYLCIGNGNYLSVYNFGNDSAPNNSQWVRHMLFLDVGVEVTGLTATSQYLHITAAKQSTNANRNYQIGYMYTWDGTNQAPNRKIPIPMGAPYSPFTLNNIPYCYVAGSLFAYGGGDSLIKVRYMAYQNTDYLGMVDHTVVNPNMMDARYNLLLLGYPSMTTHDAIPMGVYSWGSVELTYPNSFGYSYALASQQQFSSGTLNGSPYTNLQLGTIKNFVDTLYTSWQYTDSDDITHYGLDVTDNTSDPAPVAKWRSLIWDGGAVYKVKRSTRFMVSFLPLPAGVTITGVYDFDRNGEVNVNLEGESLVATEGMDSLLINIPEGRARELQFGFDIACAPGSTTPTITGATFEIDQLADEGDLREYTPNG